MAWLHRSAVIGAVFIPLAAVAQQPPPPTPPAPQPQTLPSDWSKMPRMQLERQFAGPLQDTIVQRWRDPVDGMICYMYLPISTAHSAPTPSGFVQYGANNIGAISCVAPPEPPTVAAAPAPKRPPVAR